LESDFILEIEIIIEIEKNNKDFLFNIMKDDCEIKNEVFLKIIELKKIELFYTMIHLLENELYSYSHSIDHFEILNNFYKYIKPFNKKEYNKLLKNHSNLCVDDIYYKFYTELFSTNELLLKDILIYFDLSVNIGILILKKTIKLDKKRIFNFILKNKIVDPNAAGNWINKDISSDIKGYYFKKLIINYNYNIFARNHAFVMLTIQNKNIKLFNLALLIYKNNNIDITTIFYGNIMSVSLAYYNKKIFETIYEEIKDTKNHLSFHFNEILMNNKNSHGLKKLMKINFFSKRQMKDIYTESIKNNYKEIILFFLEKDNTPALDYYNTDFSNFIKKLIQNSEFNTIIKMIEKKPALSKENLILIYKEILLNKEIKLLKSFNKLHSKLISKEDISNNFFDLIMADFNNDENRVIHINFIKYFYLLNKTKLKEYALESIQYSNKSIKKVFSDYIFHSNDLEIIEFFIKEGLISFECLEFKKDLHYMMIEHFSIDDCKEESLNKLNFIKFIIKNYDFDLSFNDNDLLKEAMLFEKKEIALLLLEDNNVFNSININFLKLHTQEDVFLEEITSFFETKIKLNKF
jgi:hypothetical protein